MMGRAGRPQFDDSGVSCIFVHEPKKNFYKKFLHEPFPVESSLLGQLHNHINAEIAGQSIRNLEECIEYISWTYFFRRLVVNPSYYGLSDNSNEGIREFLVDKIKEVLTNLESERCITTNEKMEISSTFLGSIASQHYIHYKSVGSLDAFVRSSLNSEFPDVRQVLFAICETVEFSELPVRHNEDNLNAMLAQECQWGSELRDFDSSNVKANLLLQAHFFGLALPISDYVSDTKSVLDQLPRVLIALIDIAVKYENARLVESALVFSQMLVQV